VYGPFFAETTFIGIMYRGMFQQFFIPQLDEDDQEGHIHFQQEGAPLITLEKCASISTPVSQVGGADSMATLFPGSYTPRFFVMGIR
jgi:hypothetical protein